MIHPSPIRTLAPFVLVAVGWMAQGCAPGSRLISRSDVHAASLEELAPFLTGQPARPIKGSGLVTVRVTGAEYRGRLDVIRHSEQDFSCSLFDPLGNEIARLWSAGGKAGLDRGDASLPVNLSSVANIPGVMQAPITFAGLIRILAGRVPFALPDEPEVDSLLLKGRRLWFQFKTDSETVRVAVDKRSGDLREATCSSPDARRWSVAYGDFRDAFPHRIRIDLGQAGSFEVHYDRIIFLTDSSSRAGSPRVATARQR